MKKSTFVLILILHSLLCMAQRPAALSVMSFSQTNDSLIACPEDLFSEYAKDLYAYGIEISKPTGFFPVDLRPAIFFIAHSPCFPISPQSMYPLALSSEDKNALILYPQLYFIFGNNTLRLGHEIERELRATHADCELDVNPYVNLYDMTKLKNYAFADTIALYNLDVVAAKAQLHDVYPRCIGVYLRKAGHPALLLKILMTEDGYGKRNEYLKMLLDNITYSRVNIPLAHIERQLKGIFTDLTFPTVPLRLHQPQPNPQMDSLPLEIPHN